MSFSPVQERSVPTPQQAAALERGNVIRKQRAEIRRTLHNTRPVTASLRTLHALMQENPEAIQNMTFADLLECCYSIGRRKMLQLIRAMEVSATIRVCDLTERQRYRIHVVLDEL